MTEKYKTRDQWKQLMNDLKPEEFQDMCYDIISNNAFTNPLFRGKGADGGRDIEAEFEYLVGKEKKKEKCWFQAKRQKSGVNFNQFSTEVQKAEDQGVKRFFIMSNSDTTAQCKDDINNWNEKHKCEINDWSGTRFLDLLFELPHICKSYFPDEEVPPLLNIKSPSMAIQQSAELGKRFRIRLYLNVGKNVNLNNPSEVSEILKDSLLKIKDIDINIKALVYQKISMFFFSLEKVDDALMFLEKSLEITPKNIDALLSKAFILEKIDNVDESNVCYDEILRTDPENKFALNNKAHNYRRQGKLEEALELVNTSLGHDKNFIISIKNKAEILKSLNRFEESLSFLEEKNTLVDKSASLQQTKVDLYIELLDLKRAFELNEEILRRDPRNLDSINNKGVIYEKNSQHQHRAKYLNLALGCFENALELNEKYPLGWSNKCVIQVNSGNFDEAEKIIDLAYAFFPKNAHVLHQKGVVFLAKGKIKEALKYFNKALNTYYRQEFLIDRARAFLEMKQWQSAISDADRVLKYDPKNSDAWRIKSKAAYKLHEVNKSRNYEKKADKFRKKPRSLLED